MSNAINKTKLIEKYFRKKRSFEKYCNRFNMKRGSEKLHFYNNWIEV